MDLSWIQWEWRISRFGSVYSLSICNTLATCAECAEILVANMLERWNRQYLAARSLAAIVPFEASENRSDVNERSEMVGNAILS